MNITRGPMTTAIKVCIYGPEGIGKSTFASQFPDPVFIDTEGSTKYLDVARFDPPRDWDELLQMVEYVRSVPGVCRTLVLDTADWAERLCTDAVCTKFKKKGIEDFGYGKGYIYLCEEFGKLLNMLTDVVAHGVNVVVTAHAMMRKFEQPDEMGAYDRWELKLSKKVAPMVKEWADTLLFANYKTIVITDQDGRGKAQGGMRVIYTSHHPCWDAKNRQGLPEEIPMDYTQIAHIVPELGAPQPTQVLPPQRTQIQQPTLQTAPQMAPQPTEADWPDGDFTMDDLQAEEPAEQEFRRDVNLPPLQQLPADEPVPWELTDDDIYLLPENASPEIKQLYELMKNSGISPVELQTMCTMKRYMPAELEPYSYPLDFVAQCLIPAWSSVVGQINELKNQKG